MKSRGICEKGACTYVEAMWARRKSGERMFLAVCRGVSITCCNVLVFNTVKLFANLFCRCVSNLEIYDHF